MNIIFRCKITLNMCLYLPDSVNECTDLIILSPMKFPIQLPALITPYTMIFKSIDYTFISMVPPLWSCWELDKIRGNLSEIKYLIISLRSLRFFFIGIDIKGLGFSHWEKIATFAWTWEICFIHRSRKNTNQCIKI